MLATPIHLPSLFELCTLVGAFLIGVGIGLSYKEKK